MRNLEIVGVGDRAEDKIRIWEFEGIMRIDGEFVSIYYLKIFFYQFFYQFFYHHHYISSQPYCSLSYPLLYKDILYLILYYKIFSILFFIYIKIFSILSFIYYIKISSIHYIKTFFILFLQIL